MGRIKRSGLLGSLILVLALALAACGSSSSSSSTSSSGGSGSSSTATKSSFKLGVVTDVGGLNDHGFNHLAYEGMLSAEKQLGIQAKVLPSNSSADYIPNLTSLARQGYNLVIATGFNFETPLAQVAKQFPDTKFAIIDDVAADVDKGALKNVEGLSFKEEQAGYLAGYLAGLVSKAKGYSEISSVSGQDYPSVTNYVGGYQQGAAAADPSIKTVNAFSDDFADQSKCQTIAQNQISAGAKIVFQVAGGCGLGALQAAKKANLMGIGVDADQSFLGSYILTSAEKRVDTAVLDAAKDAMNGTFKAGGDLTFDLANGGVGYGTLNSTGKQYASQLAAVAAKIKSGAITVTTKYHNS
jgi:basic membrane protein A